MTTAEYRKLAQDAERRLDWGAAARLWQLAIDNYPAHAPGIAALDIARMTSRQKSAAAALAMRLREKGHVA